MNRFLLLPRFPHKFTCVTFYTLRHLPLKNVWSPLKILKTSNASCVLNSRVNDAAFFGVGWGAQSPSAECSVCRLWVLFVILSLGTASLSRTDAAKTFVKDKYRKEKGSREQSGGSEGGGREMKRTRQSVRQTECKKNSCEISPLAASTMLCELSTRGTSQSDGLLNGFSVLSSLYLCVWSAPSHLILLPPFSAIRGACLVSTAG